VAVRFDSASRRAEARVGSVIKDKWTLDRVIGVGGMAAVYAATHRNKKRAAIKMLHAELSLDSVMRERFLREGYAANSVGQRGAVGVDDDDVTDDGCAFIVMELLDGETIDARWDRKARRLPPQEVLSIADQLLDTLAAAHQKGIVHRDIKPENLFLTRDGVVKVLDFGIARLHELKGPKTSTQTGNTMGTPAFMAPEQARGKWEDVDERTDLWAVGATMFTLLTGDYVHEGETVNETLALAVTQPARSVRALRPDLHPSLIQLVDKALRYDKRERWADAHSMQEALRRVYLSVQGEDVSRAPALSVPEPGREPMVMVPETPSLPEPRPDRTRQLTTARGVTASGQPTLRRSVMLQRRLAIAGALAAVLLVLVLVATFGDSRDGAVAAASGVALGASAPPAALSAPPAALSAPPAPSAEPRAVTLDELPKEQRKATSGKAVRSAPPSTTSTKRSAPKDPFARRR
jgi:eukaryotic-like serine/threonine-protein kinase